MVGARGARALAVALLAAARLMPVAAAAAAAAEDPAAPDEGAAAHHPHGGHAKAEHLERAVANQSDEPASPDEGAVSHHPHGGRAKAEHLEGAAANQSDEPAAPDEGAVSHHPHGGHAKAEHLERAVANQSDEPASPDEGAVSHHPHGGRAKVEHLEGAAANQSDEAVPHGVPKKKEEKKKKTSTTTHTITRTLTSTTTHTKTKTSTTATRTTTTRTTTTRTTSTTTSRTTTTTSTRTATSTTVTVTTTTTSTTSVTSTTTTTSTSTSTTSSTTTSTSTTTTTRPHVFGGAATRDAFEEWLKVWRGMYIDGTPCGTVTCLVPEMDDALMPSELQGVRAKVLVSKGGVASGVVTEGMGYAIMVEGFLAVEGRNESIELGLGLMKSWMGMTFGPEGCGNPRGGGSPVSPLEHDPKVVTKVDSGKYGVSAIEASRSTRLGPAGVPSWKYPLDQCGGEFGCVGSATDGDEDALLGMIYLTSALGYPPDMVDVVMRTLIAFASADLGFPDLYRTLPSGERMYVPKGGSDWGGLLPEKGKFKTQQEPWCYSPSYFAPAHYRAFRDFAGQSWRPYFDEYLPPREDGTKTTLLDLTAAFDGAIAAGYNLLYRASCESGAVSNWVGVKAECEDPAALNCQGVPWAHTPYVGESGTCSASGTEWGSYGADASRAAWRVAMDYTLYKEESDQLTIYGRDGHPDKDAYFSANVFLNRIVRQYVEHSKCNGAVPGDCFASPGASPWKIAAAFDYEANPPPNITCDSAPIRQATWWASYMAYPTFTAFVAPIPDLIPEDSSAWMDTFSSLCDWGSDERVGLCATTYFEASQSLIASMIMAKVLQPFLLPPDREPQDDGDVARDPPLEAPPRADLVWDPALEILPPDAEALQQKHEEGPREPSQLPREGAGPRAAPSAERAPAALAVALAALAGGVLAARVGGCVRGRRAAARLFPRAEVDANEDGEHLLAACRGGSHAASPL